MTYHNVNEHIDFFFKLGEACDLNLGAWDQGWGKKNDQKLRIMSSHGIDQQHSQGEMEVWGRTHKIIKCISTLGIRINVESWIL